MSGKAKGQRLKAEVRWKIPSVEMPDADITVCLRLKNGAWPIVLGWMDADGWTESNGILIEDQSTILGWMHIEDAAKILDFGSVITEGGGE